MKYKKLYKQTKMVNLHDHVQIKLPWIPEAPGCSPVVEHITVGRSFSQPFKVKPKHCIVKMGITCQDLTDHIISQNRDAGLWLDA